MLVSEPIFSRFLMSQALNLSRIAFKTALILSLFSFCAIVFAQTPPPVNNTASISSVPDPITKYVDENGVDLMSGGVSINLTELAIGQKNDELFIKHGIGQLPELFQNGFSTINVRSYLDDGSYKIGSRISLLVEGTQKAVLFQCDQRSTGGQAAEQCPNPTNFQGSRLDPPVELATDERQSGGIIEAVPGGKYKYTDHESTEYILEKSADMYSPNGTARLLSIKYANGRGETFTYKDLTYKYCYTNGPSWNPGPEICRNQIASRLQSKVRSDGYIIKGADL
jgi:hypothetical protein